jgi:hypothetical protein
VNSTFELVNLPKGKKALKKVVHPRYNERLVVNGFGQKQGIDFDEIFSPMVKQDVFYQSLFDVFLLYH